VFQQWGKGQKISEQWCFNNGEKGEKLLNNGVSAMGKRAKNEEKCCWKVMFRQWVKGENLLNSGVSSMGKRVKNEEKCCWKLMKKEGVVFHKMKLGSS
jgi:hypothetical protein